MPPISHVIFDLDGTLVDSLPGIESSARAALMDVCPEKPVPDLRSLLGPPIREVLHRALNEEDPAVLDALQSVFRVHYDQQGWMGTFLYPGVREVLDALRSRGLTMIVLTNKPALPTGRIMEQLVVSEFFNEVVTPDSRMPPFSSKVEAARYLKMKRGLRGDNTLLVGDSADDVAAAHACDFLFGSACFGYGGAGDIPGGTVHFRLKAFADLVSIIEGTVGNFS